MDQPIYKLFFFRLSPRARALTPEQLQEVIHLLDEPAARFGVRQLLVAEMRWSNERFEYFGVEQFPSQEAQQAHTRRLEELGWYDYVEGESYLGMPLDGTANELTFPEPPPAGEQSIYRVYLSRLTTYGQELPTSRLNEVWALGRDALSRVGGVPLLAAYTRWNDETWDSFGIERFPSSQAALTYSQYLSVSGWYRVSAARSHLGLAVGGLLSGDNGS
jgi:hypothetical protein